MRRLAVLMLLGSTIGLLSGCASQSKPKEGTQLPSPPAPVAQLAYTAAALAFDPPAGIPMSDDVLARDTREPNAYVGYDQTIATYSVTQTTDRQRLYDRYNDYDRTVYSAKIGVSIR